MKYWFAAFLAVFVVMPPSILSAAEPDYSRRPILMIHGYFPVNAGDWVTWGRFKDKLIEDGWPKEYIMNPKFKDPTGCDPDHAREISAWVDELLEKTGWDKVDIIAHSEGGLNTMYYLRHFCGVHKVRNFVGLAIAVHGTRVACVDFVSCGADEMCIPSEKEGGWRQNETLAAVNACDETLGDIRYTSIWSDYDEIIIPQEGSIIYGARNIELETPMVEHGLIFLVDESLNYIKDALKNKSGYNTDGPGWDCIPQCILPDQAEQADQPEQADVPTIPEAVEVNEGVVEEPSGDVIGDVASDVTSRDVEEADGVIVVPYDAGPKDRGTPDPDDILVTRDLSSPADEGTQVPEQTDSLKGGCSSTGHGNPWSALLVILSAVAMHACGRLVRRRG